MKKLTSLILFAAMAVMLPATSQADDWITGDLNLDFNTHFVSYGADVWGAGGDTFDDILFNPSIGLNFDLGNGASIFGGTWWDVNDNAETSIGGDIVQEVDVWVGTSFDVGEVGVTLQYQEWMYADQSERVVDAIFGLPGELSPSVTIHGRIDGEGLETGVVGVLGIEPSYDFGGQSVSFPINVAGATDEFHGGDSGFAYASAGAGTSFDIAKDTSLNLGATYYYTDDGVIPNNADDSFITVSAGVGFSF